MDEDTLQLRAYFLEFMNSLKVALSQFNKTFMLLMEYPSIEVEGIPDDAKQVIWNLLHAYIYAHRQMLIDEYPGGGVEAITNLKYQCSNMTFPEKLYIIDSFKKWFTKKGSHK